jgi:hypothetical protein
MLCNYYSLYFTYYSLLINDSTIRRWDVLSVNTDIETNDGWDMQSCTDLHRPAQACVGHKLLFALISIQRILLIDFHSLKLNKIKGDSPLKLNK